MEYKMIREHVIEDRTREITKTKDFIKNGFGDYPDQGIERYSTKLRLEQYRNGTITRDEVVELATKRVVKSIEKRHAKQLAYLDRVEKAKVATYIDITVTWTKSGTPHATVVTDDGVFKGTAYGGNYNLQSAAVAVALNQSLAIAKILFDLKEQGLREGKSDVSTTACTGRDNRLVCGYGTGYASIPYFETSGVGIGSFMDVFNKSDYKVTERHSKGTDFYTIEYK